MIFLTHEGLVFAHDDFWNAVKKDGTAAHGAGGQGGVELAVAVDFSRLSSGILKGVHFAVENGAVFLNAPIVSAPDDFPLVDDDATDGDSSFFESQLSFRNCGF